MKQPFTVSSNVKYNNIDSNTDNNMINNNITCDTKNDLKNNFVDYSVHNDDSQSVEHTMLLYPIILKGTKKVKI